MPKDISEISEGGFFELRVSGGSEMGFVGADHVLKFCLFVLQIFHVLFGEDQ